MSQGYVVQGDRWLGDRFKIIVVQIDGADGAEAGEDSSSHLKSGRNNFISEILVRLSLLVK